LKLTTPHFYNLETAAVNINVKSARWTNHVIIEKVNAQCCEIPQSDVSLNHPNYM